MDQNLQDLAKKIGVRVYCSRDRIQIGIAARKPRITGEARGSPGRGASAGDEGAARRRRRRRWSGRRGTRRRGRRPPAGVGEGRGGRPAMARGGGGRRWRRRRRGGGEGGGAPGWAAGAGAGPRARVGGGGELVPRGHVARSDWRGSAADVVRPRADTSVGGDLFF